MYICYAVDIYNSTSACHERKLWDGWKDWLWTAGRIDGHTGLPTDGQIVIMKMGRGGSVVSSVPCVRRVAGSKPTLAAT